MRTVLILLNDVDSMVLAAVARSLDAHSLLITDEESAADAPEGRVLVTDCTDPAKVIAAAQAWRDAHHATIAGVIGMDEEHAYAVSAALAAAFGVPAPSEESRRIASDKLFQHGALAARGVHVPKYAPYPGTAQIQFPNVLKAARGIGNIDVRVNRDAHDLARHAKQLKGALLIEEYIRGEEFSCDYLADGRVLRVAAKRRTPSGVFTAFHLFHPDETPAGFTLAQLTDTCARAARALRIADGVCMMDFILRDGEIVVLETTIRPGIAPFLPLMQELYGWTSVGQAVRERLGEPTVREPPRGTGLVCQVLIDRPGVIDRIDLRALEKMHGFLRAIPYYATGERAEDIPGRTPVTVAEAHFKDVRREDIDAIVAAVQAAAVVEVRDA